MVGSQLCFLFNKTKNVVKNYTKYKINKKEFKFLSTANPNVGTIW